MKNIFISLILISFISLSALAETDSTRIISLNLQAHSNASELLYNKNSSIINNLPLFTFTLEGTGNDKIGSTYFFIDWEIGNANLSNDKYFSGSYIEFTRNWCFWQQSNLKNLEIHTEINAGAGYGSDSWGSQNNGWDFKPALICGVAYSWSGKKWFFQLQLLNRYEVKDRYNNGGEGWQLTEVWNYNFNSLFYISGYSDIWQSRINGKLNDSKSLHLAIEPYLWFRISNAFEVGSRFRFTYNYYTDKSNGTYDKKYYFAPTIALKWNIN